MDYGINTVCKMYNYEDDDNNKEIFGKNQNCLYSVFRLKTEMELTNKPLQLSINIYEKKEIVIKILAKRLQTTIKEKQEKKKRDKCKNYR